MSRFAQRFAFQVGHLLALSVPCEDVHCQKAEGYQQQGCDANEHSVEDYWVLLGKRLYVHVTRYYGFVLNHTNLSIKNEKSAMVCTILQGQ